MRWHVGCLDPDPPSHRSYQWMRRRGWFKPSFPADVFEEIAIFSAMPGMCQAWLHHNWKMARHDLLKYRAMLPQYEDLKDKVIENWLSTTRDDAVKISRMRHRFTTPPLICQINMLDDYKRGMSFMQMSRDYKWPNTTIAAMVRSQRPYSGRTKWKVPADFARLFGIETRD